jgi:DGQHR domain-containing protein
MKMIYRLRREVQIKKWLRALTGYRSAELITFEWRDIGNLFPAHGRLHDYDGQIVQRNISRARVKKMADYLEERIFSDTRFTIPPIVLTILPPIRTSPDDDVRIPFTQIEEGKIETLVEDSIVVINDGQHRVEAIRLFLSRMRDKKYMEKYTKEEKKKAMMYDFERAELCAQAHCVFFAEEMQQMFADINATAQKPSKSITLFFDKANDFNSSVAKVIELSSVLQGRTDVQKNVCSGKSPHVFTMATVTAALRELFVDKGARDGLDDEEIQLAVDVLEKVSWLWDKEVWSSAEAMREQSLAPHAVFLKGLMTFMRALVESGKFPEVLTIPWQRHGNKHMLHRCVDQTGKILAGAQNALLVSAELKNLNDYPLTPAERQVEAELQAQLKSMADMHKARNKDGDS